jgi:hypothetical protein
MLVEGLEVVFDFHLADDVVVLLRSPSTDH